MSFISAGGAITLGGTAVYPAISTANGAGVGGAISVGTKITVGTLTSTGTGIGGAIILAREVVSSTILASGSTGGAITLGDECITGSITSKPLTAAGIGGAILISDDCVTGAVDSSGTVAGTFGGAITILDRCECGTITSAGSSGGGASMIGEGLTATSIDTQSTVSGNAGTLVVSHRATLSAGINTSGVANSGAITIGQNLNAAGSILAVATTGNSGPISLGDGSHYASLSAGAGTNVGNITIGKFSVIGTIGASASAGSRGTFTILDGTTVTGTITGTAATTGGVVSIGTSVIVTGNINFDTVGVNSAATIGMGCNLQAFRAGSSNASTGGINVGQATSVTQLLCNTGGLGGSTAGNISLGEGCRAIDVYTNSYNAGGSSGNVVLEPGATAAYIQVDTISGTAGNVTLKNSNVITGINNFGIVMGAVNTGTISAINARIKDFIDNVNGSSLFRDCIFSTPAANRSCIANLTASGSQYTNCLFVPHGTGFSMQATVPRTIIAYFMLQKNPLPPNVTLSEGSVTTSANLLAP